AVFGVLAAGLAVLCSAALTAAIAGTSDTSTSKSNTARQRFAQHILKTRAAQFMTAPALSALHIQATGNMQLTEPLVGRPPVRAQSAAATAAIPSANLPNVRVNNPARDTHQVDQTTQSETTIAVAGPHVAVGYNDSQQTGLGLTAGSNLTG